MWGGELAPLSTKMGGFALFAIHYGRAGHTGHRSKGCRAWAIWGLFFSPLLQGQGHRSTATGPEPGPDIQARPWANRPKLGVPSFILTFGCHPIAGPDHRAKGHRPKAGRPKLGVLIFGPSFGDRLGKLSFLGRPVCGGILSPLTSQPVKLSAHPNYGPKKKAPNRGLYFRCGGLS